MKPTSLNSPFPVLILLLLGGLTPARAQVGPGTALSLSGTAYVNVPSNPSLALSNRLTFEAWVNVSAKACNTILSRGNGSDTNTDYIFQTGYDGSTCGTSNRIGFFVAGAWHYSTKEVSLNNWNHVAVTYNGTNVNFYINGGLDSIVTQTGAIYQSGSPLYLGRQGSTCNCNFFQGSMDEVRIWNSARTATDIMTNMNHALTGSETGLIAYYRFNEASGSTATNSAATGSANNGSFVNSPTRINSGALFVPDVVVGTAMNLCTSSNSATLNGTVNPGNSPTVSYFEWGDYGVNRQFPYNSSPSTNIGAANTAVAVRLPIFSPSSGWDFYYRIVAYNSAGTNYSGFVNLALPLFTDFASSITVNSAQLNAVAASGLLPATVHFQWGTTTNYGNVTSNFPVGTTTNLSASVSQTLAGLIPATTYHYRVVWSGPAGSQYGNDMPFATLADMVTVAATNITANSATLNGEVSLTLLPATVYFQWGTDTNYGNLTAMASIPAGDSDFTDVSAPVAGLSAAITYHYRVACSNNAGIKYGNDVFFGALATDRGTWVPLANRPPASTGHMVLLTDGSVLAESYANGQGPGWFRLSPDNHGSYVNGTWSNISPMHCGRAAFETIVLRDGRLFVSGGEYGTGTTNAEIYDPVGDFWSIVPIPSGIITTNNNPQPPYYNSSAGFSDAGAVLLSNGKVLITPVFPATNGNTVTYDPVSNLWSTATLVRGGNEDEASITKLPDDSIVVIDFPSDTHSERYIPALNAWIDDADVPVALYDIGSELGPGMMLPNGKAIVFGGNGHTAIYTPSGTTKAGSWAVGPDFPNLQGMPDAPAAMLVNGRILCAVSDLIPAPGVVPVGTSYYEYDSISNTFTLVPSPTGGSLFQETVQHTRMLDLPDGSVLIDHAAPDFYFYRPADSPLASARPVILGVTTNSDGSLHFTGRQFNGISAGASFGDDAQMDSNFPLVRFTDALGIVRYGRTYNWSSTSVQTGTNIVSTDCTMPAGASPQDFIEVVANGISSGENSLIVSNINDSGSGSLRQTIASATNNSFIRFLPSLSGQTITLTSGQILLNKNLVIDASTLPNGIRVDGAHSSRLFTVSSGVIAVLNRFVMNNGYPGTGNSGGAIANSGTLRLNSCTLASNTVDSNATSGAIANGGNLTLRGCTVSGNSAGSAGAIDNSGTCTLLNCTFAANSTTAGNGGAIDNVFGATLNLVNCTFSGNTATGAGGAIDNYLSQVNLTNTILAGNTASDIYNWSGSTISCGSSNIVRALQNAGVVNNSFFVINADPLLLPLANYGGPTQTMPPQLGSPAIDAGDSSVAAALVWDQRGPDFSRQIANVDLGAVEVSVPSVVSTAADSGYGSLRYAATWGTNNQNISFAPGLSGQTISLTSGEIVVSAGVTIDGSALANPVRIDGNNNSRIFNVASGSVTFNSMILTHGYNAVSGGAIYNAGSLTLNNCTIALNSVSASGLGGAILNHNQLTMLGCTLYTNSAQYGGAILSYGPCTLQNCTLTGNRASANGGALYTQYATAILNLLHCTFSLNHADSIGAAIVNDQSQANITNTVIAGNSSSFPQDVDTDNGTTTFGGTNIAWSWNNTNGVVVGQGSIINPDPMLASLGNYGGPTLTMPPRQGSPAVDRGSTAAASGLAYDQRGFPRVAGDAVDIGAVEADINPFVFTTADSGYGSLRYAVQYTTNYAMITFAPGLSGQSIILTSGQISLDKILIIDGTGLPNGIQINGNASSTIFEVQPGQTVTLNSLTIVNGHDSYIAGIYNNSGVLGMNNCTVASNTATAGTGGIFNFSGTLIMNNCTVAKNSSTQAGSIVGGILNAYGTAMLNSCTVSSNSSSPLGGVGGIENYHGSLTMNNTILSGNTGPVPNLDGGFVGANNLVNVPNIGLAALGNHSGPTPTMPPLPGSPAVDTGSDAAAAAAGLLTDQRGFPRISGDHVDIGAAELQLVTAGSPSVITNLTMVNGAIQFSFPNQSGASFRVFATTDVTQPQSAWQMIGFALESPPASGQFQFTDLQATNFTQRFYRVRSP